MYKGGDSIKTSVLGLGTVGRAFKEIYELNEDKISKSLVRDTSSYPKDNVTDDFTVILHEKPDVIVEAIGGVEPAYTYLKQAMEQGIHVVTANKDLIAEKGKILRRLALENGVNLKCEATIGGGIPILSTINHYLKRDTVVKIEGIFNGTSNFILTLMSEGLTFNQALERAIEGGYCESNPSADLKGFDVARKICVLLQTIDYSFIDWRAIEVVDLEAIDPIWFKYAKANDLKVKLIATIVLGPVIQAELEAVLVDKNDRAFAVDYEKNYIHFESRHLKGTSLIGYGAGGSPTGYALYQDVIDIQENDVLNLQDKRVEPLDIYGKWVTYNDKFEIYEGKRRENSIRLRSEK